MLTGLLLVCAATVLTNAAAVPEAEPDGGVEMLSAQHAVPDATRHETVFVQKAVEEGKPVAVNMGRSMREPVQEGKTDYKPVVASIQGGERDPVVLQKSSLCSCGWSHYNGRYFLYVPTLATWADAEMNCQARGGNLASVHSFDEYQFVQQMIFENTRSYPVTWLGGSNAQQNNVWLWSDGSRFSFLNWCKGEPNNKYDEHCLQMNFSDERCWNDLQCSKKQTFVCSKNGKGDSVGVDSVVSEPEGWGFKPTLNEKRLEVLLARRKYGYPYVSIL